MPFTHKFCYRAQFIDDWLPHFSIAVYSHPQEYLLILYEMDLRDDLKVESFARFGARSISAGVWDDASAQSQQALRLTTSKASAAKFFYAMFARQI